MQSNNVENKKFKNDKRWSEREVVYMGDMPEIVLSIAGTGIDYKASAMDISASGIGLCHEEFNDNMVGKEVCISICKMKKYSLIGTVTSFSRSMFSGEMQNRIGIQFKKSVHSLMPRPNRYKCPSNFNALVFGEHPFKFNHTLQYSVVEFSHSGMSMKCSSIKDLLLPGVTVDLNLIIPRKGNFKTSVHITNMREVKETGEFVVGCFFIDPKPEMLYSISSYLLSNKEEEYNVDDLKKNGLLVSEIDEVAHFYFAGGENEWNEILKLRLESSQSVGRWVGNDDPKKLVDPFDKHARQLYCKIGNRIVGSGRVVYNNGVRERSEHCQIAKVPEYIWEKGFVECSRVCTKNDYRGANLFVLIIQQLAVLVVKSNSKYAVLNCEDTLVPVYKKFGVIDLNQRFFTEFMQDTALNLLCFEMDRILYGKGVNPIAWQLVWRSVQEHLQARGLLQPTFKQKIRLSVYKILGGVLVKTFLANKTKRLLAHREEMLKVFTNKESLEAAS